MNEDFESTSNVSEFPGTGKTKEETTVQSILRQPDQDFLDFVEDVFSRIDKLELERKELNDKIKAEKSDLEAKGLNGHAFKAVKAFWDKMKVLNRRESRWVSGRIRVSAFRNED